MNGTTVTNDRPFRLAPTARRPGALRPLRPATTRLARRWIDAELLHPRLADPAWIAAHCTTADPPKPPFVCEPPFVCDDLLASALSRLDPLARDILIARRLRDDTADLRALAAHHQISPHRASQIEHRALAAVQDWLRAAVTAKRTKTAAAHQSPHPAA